MFVPYLRVRMMRVVFVVRGSITHVMIRITVNSSTGEKQQQPGDNE